MGPLHLQIKKPGLHIYNIVYCPSFKIKYKYDVYLCTNNQRQQSGRQCETCQLTRRLTPGTRFPSPPLHSLNKQVNINLLSFKITAQLPFLKEVVPELPVYVSSLQSFIEWNAHRTSLVSGFTFFLFVFYCEKSTQMRSTLLANIYVYNILLFTIGTMLHSRSLEHIILLD